MKKEVIKGMMEIAGKSFNDSNETKSLKDDKQKTKNKVSKFCNCASQLTLTVLITIIYCYYIISPTIEEVISYTNTPSFPLNIKLILPKNVNINCIISFYNGEEKTKTIQHCPKGQYIINITELLNTNITLNNEGNLQIFVFVKDNNYTKIQKEKISIQNGIFTFNKDNEVVPSFRSKDFHLDSVVKTSNERKEAKYFYYFIQSHRIINEGDIYDFNIIDDDERIRRFSWENMEYQKDCNFVIYLSRNEYFRLTERKRSFFLEEFVFFFGVAEFLWKIVIKKILITIKEMITEKIKKWKNNNIKTSPNLLNSEIMPNNDRNIELENQNAYDNN